MSNAAPIWLQAIIEADAQNIGMWLDEGGDLGETYEGGTALYHAAHRGRADIVALLVARGPSFAPSGQRSLLHAAAQGGVLDLVVRLLDDGVPVDLQDSFGSTPLCDAVYEGRRAVVELLLARGADPTVRIASGQWQHYSAVELAIHRVCPKCASVLLKAGGRYEPNIIPPAGAWKPGMHLFAYMLLEWRREDSPTSMPRYPRESLEDVASVLCGGPIPPAGDPLVELAILFREQAGERDLQEARELTKKTAKIRVARQFARAVEMGDAAAVKKLLPKASKRELPDLLEEASSRGHADVVRLLADHPSIEAEDIFTRGEVCPPLLRAAEAGHFEVVELLADKGADLDAWTDADGQYRPETALGLALNAGHEHVARLLAEKGARPDTRSGCSAFVLTVQQLEDYANDAEGRTSLMDDMRDLAPLARCGSAGALAWFLEERRKRSSTRDDTPALLFDAILRDDAARVEVILDYDNSVGILFGAVTPLDVARRFGASAAASLLEARGGTAKYYGALVASTYGREPRANHDESAEHAPATNSAPDPLGPEAMYERYRETPLHAACERGNLAGIRALLKQGADPNARARRRTTRPANRTPLFALISSWNASPDVMTAAKVLIDKGAEVNAVDAEGLTPLDLATMQPMRLLLRSHGGMTGRQVAERADLGPTVET